jgi:hypothetical protein
MQEQMGVGSVGVHINVVYAARVERTGATNDSVHSRGRNNAPPPPAAALSQ